MSRGLGDVYKRQIAVCVTQVREDTYDTHGYLNSVKNEDSEIFRGLVLEEEEKYLLP